MLEGIRIVEIEGLGPAPFAGMLLADLGAEVTVVHRPDPAAPSAPERSLLDRGKQSIVLDLKQEAGVEIVRKLALEADGLIEGFRPGVMERLGLGPDALRKDNPRLVYGRLTGWGQDGPLAACAGHDLNYIGLSGALHYASPAGEPPLTPATLLGDIGGGALYLVIGMLSALLRARDTGQGAVVDAAIFDGSAHMMNLMMAARSAGLLSPRRGMSVLDGSPWSRCYRTSDNGWLSVQCLEPEFYEAFLQGLRVRGEPRYERRTDPKTWNALAGRIERRIQAKTLGECTTIFAGTDACVAPVLSPTGSAAHPHGLARRSWTEIDGQLQARPAPRFDGEAAMDPRPAPTRGQHTNEILARLGIDDQPAGGGTIGSP